MNPTLSPVSPFVFRAFDGQPLQGELTLPAGSTPGKRFPTVVLLHGSGVHDRDLTLSEQASGVPGGSAIFRDLAAALNAQGYAALRYDKRGLAAARAGERPRIRLEELERDALAVLTQGRELPGVDRERTLLLGLSEGTMLAARVAARHPELVRGLVLIGTVGDEMRETLRLQFVENILAQAPLLDLNGDGCLSVAELEEAAARYGFSLEAQAPFLGLEPEGGGWRFSPGLAPDGLLSVEPGLRGHLEGLFARFPRLPYLPESEWGYLESAHRYGPVTRHLPEYAGPALLLHGQEDRHTRPAGAEEAANAARARGRAVTLRQYPGLGHTLHPVDPQSGTDRLGTPSEEALGDLLNWLAGQGLGGGSV